MTRFLSESLQAPEPLFRLGLRRLEAAHGNPSHDIRLTAELKQQSRQKIYELGLDPNDTTDRELYLALQSRMKADDAALVKTLRTRAATYISAEGEVTSGMVHALQELPIAKHCYALKASRFKTIIKQQPPKKAMKLLGYRSLASFLKHESPASILTVAAAVEDSRWHQSLVKAYKGLKSGDFETRPVSFSAADCSKWHELALEMVAKRKHTTLCFKEIGAIVFLPFPAHAPEGSVTASLGMALMHLNEVRSASSFLKLSQVRANFGETVQKVTLHEASLQASFLDRAVPWHLVQRYYTKLEEHFNEELFEPHLQLHDLSWQSVEQALSHIEPKLAYWRDSSHLGVMTGKQPVSFNIIDVALNYCNNLAFESRLVHHFQHSLWNELLLKYLRADTIEQTVLQELHPEFAAERALA
jgi:hypothetical protein